MRKETIEIGDEYGPEYKGRYVFQEISWAKWSRILDRNTKYNPQTGLPEGSDKIRIQAETVMACLIEQPLHKPITLEKFLSEDAENGIPIKLGELFSRIANRLCSPTRQERRFLSKPSEDKNHTQQSQNTASAKSSAGQSRSSANNQLKQSANF